MRTLTYLILISFLTLTSCRPDDKITPNCDNFYKYLEETNYNKDTVCVFSESTIGTNYLQVGFCTEGIEYSMLKPHVVFQTKSVGYDSLFWDFGDGFSANTSTGNMGIYHTYATNGTFLVNLIAQDNLNNRDSISQFITIHNIRIIYFPNTFSPNGDGINDEFYPVNKDLDYFSMLIFNGPTLVFESYDRNQKWNGFNLDNIQCNSGIYRVEFIFNERNGNLISACINIQLARQPEDINENTTFGDQFHELYGMIYHTNDPLVYY